jgi:putative N6-adenine-specific DNA methylase
MPDYKGKKRFDKDGRGRSFGKRGGKERGRKNYQIDDYE